MQVYGVDVRTDPHMPGQSWHLHKQVRLSPGGASTMNITDIRSNWLVAGSIGYAAASINGRTGILSVDTSNGTLLGFVRSSGLEPRKTTMGQPAPIVQVAMSGSLLYFCQPYLPSLYDWGAMGTSGFIFRPGSGVGMGSINLDSGKTEWNDVDTIEACASPVITAGNVAYVVTVEPLNNDSAAVEVGIRGGIPLNSIRSGQLARTSGPASAAGSGREYQYVLHALHSAKTSYFVR